MAAINSARNGKTVLLLEKLSKIGTKLKATGGGRCNLINTLDNETFMSNFGRDGRFMSPALDGYRVFPVTHSSSTIIYAMAQEMTHLNITVLCN